MSPDEYENQISLLKEALKFYADPNNYMAKTEHSFPIMYKDVGHQARFALEQLKIVEEANEKIKNDYDRIIDDTIKLIENHPINLTDTIKNLKDLDNLKII